MLSLRTLLPFAALAGVGYLLFRKTARYLGDRASVGDDVFIPVGADAPAVPNLPAGANQVMIHVTGTTGADLLSGEVAGFSAAGLGGFMPLPAGLPRYPATVDRSKVTGILRDGKTVTL